MGGKQGRCLKRGLRVVALRPPGKDAGPGPVIFLRAAPCSPGTTREHSGLRGLLIGSRPVPMGPCAPPMLWQPSAWRRRAIPGDSEERLKPGLCAAESLWQAPSPGGEACWEQLQKGRLPAAGVHREGNGRLSAAFARTPPQPPVAVCVELRVDNCNFQLEKQAGKLGVLYRHTAVRSANGVLPFGSEIAPNGGHGAAERHKVACFWKYLALQRYF